MIGIYKITSPSNKVYIGQSVNIKKRFDYYIKMYPRVRQQIRLHRSLLKHGSETHKFEIIEECEVSELNDKERYYQDIFECIGKNGLNCRLTKSNDKNGHLSEDVKSKISKSKKGIKPKIESVLKSAKSNTGKKRSKEHCEMISKAHKGKINSLETRLKIRKALKGKVPYNKGIPLSKESIEKRTDKQANVYINLDTFIFYSFKELMVLHNKKSTTLIRYINKSKNIKKI